MNLLVAERHISRLKGIYRGHTGLLSIAGYGEHPGTGEQLQPRVEQIHIDDANTNDVMRTIRIMAEEPGRNVFCGASLMDPKLPRGKKGGESHIVAVNAFVCDFDDDNAAEYELRLPLPPDYVIETSPNRFQCWYLLEAPATAAEAKTALSALVGYTKSDPCAKDAGHVWRIPGLPNWPNKKKLAAGRAAKPFIARVVKDWPQ